MVHGVPPTDDADHLRPSRSRTRVGRATTAGICGFLVVLLVVLAYRLLHDQTSQSRVQAGQHERARLVPGGAPTASGSSISGAVSSDDGGAVSDALVCATEVSSSVIGAPRTSCGACDQGGRYWIPIERPGTYSVVAHAAGFSPGLTRGNGPIALTVGEHKQGVDIVLQHGGAKVSGVVRDATGGPIPNAVVRATRFEVPVSTFVVHSDNDGQFRLWVAPGPITLQARATGYAPALLYRIAPSSDVVLTLTPGSVVRGKVVAQEDGRPIPDVEVRAVPTKSWNSPMHPSARSDSEGAFAIDGLEPDSYALVAEGEGWRGTKDSPVEVGLAEVVDRVLVQVSAVTSVNGRVMGRATELPCPSGGVSLGPIGDQTPEGTSPGPRAAAVAPVPILLAPIGSGGLVHFPAVPPGRYRALVQCADAVFVDGPTELLVPQSTRDAITWRVDPGLGLAVEVRDDANQLLPNAAFLMQLPPDKQGHEQGVVPLNADASGRYRTPRELGPGAYTLLPPQGEKGDAVQVILRPGTPDPVAVLRLAGEGTLIVRVQTPTGNAIDDVLVAAVSVDTPLARSPAPGDAATRSPPVTAVTHQGTALGNGRFRVGPLASGRYRVEVSDAMNPPFTAERSKDGVVEIHRGLSEVPVTLDRAEKLRGTIVDHAGQPAPDVWVRAACSGGGEEQPSAVEFPVQLGPDRRRAVSDTAGRFVIDGVARDRTCTVRAEQPFGAVGIRKGVHAGDDVVVTMPATGSLSGTAIDPSGAPVGRFVVTIREPASDFFRSQVIWSTDGRWTIPRVPPGRVELFVDDRSGQTARAAIVLSPDTSVDDIRLQFRPRDQEPAISMIDATSPTH